MRRFSAFFLCLVFCLSLFPRYAFAAANDEVPTVIWSGYLDNGYYGVLASAENRFDAAAVALGYNPALFSSEVKSKLSDVNYGGNFYKYATTFDEVSSAAEYPDWVPAYVSIGNIISDYWHFGTGFPPWKSRATNTLYTNALIDLKLVLSGEDLGGGDSGGGSSSGNYYTMTLDAADVTSTQSADNINTCYNSATNATFDNGNVVGTSGTTPFSFWVANPYYVSNVTLYISPAVQQFISSAATDGKHVVISTWPNRYSGTHGYSIKVVVCDSYQVSRYQYNKDNLCVYYFTNGVSYSTNVNSFYHDANGIFAVLDSIPSAGTSTEMEGNGYYGYVGDIYVPPSGTWPEPTTPVTPTAPELPEPASPTVETPVTPTVPAPVWPDINITVQPAPTDTTPNDYTPWLQAILSSLNSLRSELLSEFDGLVQSLRNIFSYLLTLDSVLETHCVHIRNKIEESAVFIANYMRTLIKWLADQLDFDDLTNVEAPDNSLLTTINEKLGGGTYEPNPIKDEQGYYQWLDDLWDRFLLGDNWQSSMGSISGSFNELKTRFPFSIPWDVVALFRLFVHDPVTPVFDLPLYFSSDGSTPVHVDLTPWDSVAAVVRPLVFVIFALKLALLSRDLLGGLGADKGGL